MKQLLKTASFGLVVDITGNHFLQLISAENENHYFLHITDKQARNISVQDDVEISPFNREITLKTDNVIGSDFRPEEKDNYDYHADIAGFDDDPLN